MIVVYYFGQSAVNIQKTFLRICVTSPRKKVNPINILNFERQRLALRTLYRPTLELERSNYPGMLKTRYLKILGSYLNFKDTM